MKKGTNDGTCLKAVGLELGTKRRSQPPWVVPHSRTFFLFFSCPALVISVIDDFLHSSRTSHLRLNMSISTSRVSSTQQKFRTIRRDPSHPATLHFSTFLDQYQTARIPSLPGSTCATWPFRYAVRGGQGRIGLQKSKHRILFSFFLHSHLTLLHFYSSSFSLSASFDFSHSFTHTHTVFTLLPSPHLTSSPPSLDFILFTRIKMISNVLCLSLLVGAAMANPLPSSERHNSRSVGNKETPPSTPKSATFGRNNAPIRRSSGLDAIGSPDSINNVLSIPILSNVAGDNSNSNSLLDLGNLRERGLLDDLDLNLLGYQSETDQTTTNVAGNNNDVLTIAQKRALLDLGDVNVLGNQQESTTTTTNVQGNGNNVNVNSLNNNRDSNIDNSNRSNNGGSPSRSNKVYYDDDDEYVCSGSNRGRSGGQRNVKSHPTHTQRAVKQRKQVSFPLLLLLSLFRRSGSDSLVSS